MLNQPNNTSGTVSEVAATVDTAGVIAGAATGQPEIAVITYALSDLVQSLIELSNARSAGVVSQTSWTLMSNTIKKEILAFDNAK